MRIGPGLAVVMLLGCANEGHYKVCWSVGGFVCDDLDDDPDDVCPPPLDIDDACPTPALDIDIACARSGLDTVVLDWVDGEPGVCAGEVVSSTDHACRDGVATGLVEAGTHTLCAEALTPDRQRLTGVVMPPPVVPVSEDALVIVTLSLPIVAQCQNGLDDDLDGRIDDQDPQCSDDPNAEE